MNGRRPSQGGDLAKPGEHAVEVLQTLGFDAASIADLQSRKVVGE
jgi:crotonobetainyl-CoA:carnitine CoA-transferase CaiB-like acyl-CoA transferase